MSWPPALYVHAPGHPVTLDATLCGLADDEVLDLPFDAVFEAMTALEGGDYANPDERRQVGHFWLRAPHLAPTMVQARDIGEAVDAAARLAHEIRTGRMRGPDGRLFTDVLHIGIGGSALGPALLVDALVAPGGLAVHVLDNTDPDGVNRVLVGLGSRLATSLVVVVSKSGTTPEPANTLAIVEHVLRDGGHDVAGRMVAITVPESALWGRAGVERWLARLPMWDWVGGRFSATSVAGLFTAALAGADTAALLRGAAQMDEWTRFRDVRKNPAALLAACWYRLGDGRGERISVVLPYADRLSLLARYLQQLVMESLGKERDRDGQIVHQGLTVYGNKGSTDQHAYVQQLRDGRDDFFATFVQVLDSGHDGDVEVAPGLTTGDSLQGFLLGTRRALREAGRRSLTITIPTVDAAAIGALIALFERTVGFYATLVNVNAYDQPGVEAGKKAAKTALDLSVRIREHIAHQPGTAAEIAASLGADPMEVLYLLERLAATDRAARSILGPNAVWSIR